MPIVDVAGVADRGEPGNTSTQVASASSASSEQAAVLMGHAAATDMATRIQQLRKGQNKLREDRQKIARELKKAFRKSKHLKERARQLSEDDMVQILVMKRAKQAANAAQRTALSNDLSSASGSGSVSAARIDALDVPGPSGDRRPSPEDDKDVGPE
jgi:hypothetical protein